MLKKISKTDYAMPAAVGDFDNDSYLDLYVGFPGEKDFTVLSENNDIVRKTPQGIFFNDEKNGKRSFKEQSKFELENDRLVSVSNLFPHSSLATDFDRDGDMDILVVDDRNNLSPAYENVGNRKFVNSAKRISLINGGYGMGVTTGDFNNNGKIDVVMSNVNFNQASALFGSCFNSWNYNRDVISGKGLNYFYNNGNGTYSERASQIGLRWAGLGLAGVETIDYDNDGYLDLYVANGLWSGEEDDPKLDLASTFVRAAFAKINRLDESQIMKDSSFLNYLRKLDGRSLGLKKDKRKLSMAGFQRNRLFKNFEGKFFYDVAFIEGVDSISDGYVITVADINKDNRMDLVIRNGDPGVEKNQFPVVEVFTNDVKYNNSVVLKLIGDRVNRDAIGAEVTATIGTKKIIRQLIGNNGSAQSEKVIHFGLGDNQLISKLEVRWPGQNKVKVLKNLKSGRYKIHEKDNKLLSLRAY